MTKEETLIVPAALLSRIRHHAGDITDSDFLDLIVPEVPDVPE